MKVIVVGAGVFGVTAAIELRRRGHRVSLVDPGPIPHPLAESTDLSKVVRLDYGADQDYTALMEGALDGWRRWNRAWPEPLFHETGVLFLCREAMAPGGFEYESRALLARRGHPVERLDSGAVRRRFPAWSAGRYVDGYYNPAGGFAESGRVVTRLCDEATALGVAIRPGVEIARLDERGARVTGVIDAQGGVHAADHVVLAAGSWTPHLLPALAPSLRSIGQPVFHLRPADPAPFAAERFPVFGADIAGTGYYGFPVTSEGIVKIANHGVGRAVHPSSDERVVTAAEETALRVFLGETFPGLAGAPLAATRVCVYCDTHDEHFWIARDPDRAGLTVAAGGSGHGFKFAPILGELIADAALGVARPMLAKFRWRPEVQPARGEEAARHHEPNQPSS
ncbi:MAG: FAD-dependent oxidoreductase [Myxococcales bacterium]|nr:FAD-dependent oxidoreductase [Myxococcales bacterium]